MNETLNTIRRQLQRELHESRYQHTLGVMHTAGCLAMRYGESIQNALLAGLLHDCAKCIPSKEKIKMCMDYGICISPVEMQNPGLLHAKLGAALAKDLYQVDDPAILQAIKRHTTGAPEMSLLDKIIYVADYIEPGRDRASNLDEIRKLAFCDIDECLYQILVDSLSFLSSRNIPLDPMTEKTYLYYHKKRNQNEL